MHLRTASLFIDTETKQKWRDLPKAKATADITDVTGYLHLTRDFPVTPQKTRRNGPHKENQSRFCRRWLICFTWSQLTHDLTPFLTHLWKFSRHLIQLPSAKHANFMLPDHHQLADEQIPFKMAAKVTRTNSIRNPSHWFFFSGTAHSKTLTRQLKLEETWATSDQSGKEIAKMGSFHGEHTVPLLQKHLVLGSLQHYRKGDILPSEILRAELVQPPPCHCFRNRLWKQQPMRYPWNSSSVGDTQWEKQEQSSHSTGLLLFPGEQSFLTGSHLQSLRNPSF